MTKKIMLHEFLKLDNAFLDSTITSALRKYIVKEQLLINGTINENSLKTLIDDIHRIDQETENLVNLLTINEIGTIEDNRRAVPLLKNIDIKLSSGGGASSAGFAMHDIIADLPYNVSITATGWCMSAAIIVLLAASERYATANTSFMIHGGQTMVFGKLPEIQNSLDFYNLEELKFKTIISAKTKMSTEELDSIFSSGKDYFFMLDKAKEIGLINK